MTLMVRLASHPFLLGFSLCALAACQEKPPSQTTAVQNYNETAIRQLFGPDLVRLFRENYPATALKPGEKKVIDLKHDGVPSLEVGMALPQGRAGKPFVYMGWDRNGDWQKNGGPDHLNDLWMADWDGDGKIDRIVAYHATPQGTLDTQVIYYATFMNDRPGALIGKNFAPSSDFFHTTDFEYLQPADQWLSNYSGSKWFSMFYFDDKAGAMRATNESPFCFFDKTGRGFSSVVLRVANDVEWNGKHFATFRYSFDADGDAESKFPYDTDFSISGIGPNELGKHNAKPFQFGNTQTLPVILWEDCEKSVLAGRWNSVALTWIEDDRNAGGDASLADPTPRKSKRWEGVINRGSDAFPQIGGPPVLEINSRTEVGSSGATEILLYESPLDQKLHLKGARRGVTALSLKKAGKADFSVETNDTDGDGYFDEAIYQVGKTKYIVKNVAHRDVFDVRKGAYSELVDAYRALLASQVSGLCDVANSVHEKFRDAKAPHCESRHFTKLGAERKRFELFGGLFLTLNKLRRDGKIKRETVQLYLENHRSDLKLQ